LAFNNLTAIEGDCPMRRRALLAGLAALYPGLAMARAARRGASVDLSDPARFEGYNAVVGVSTFKGAHCLDLRPQGAPGDPTGSALAVVRGAAFHNGVIELEVASEVRPGADPLARGFAGLAFRVAPEARAYETFYLRPTNGRAEDQLRRNHSVQYTSEPDWPWMRLRKETPGVYESYTDLVPGRWTRVRAEIDGARARFWVGDAAQPCLIVNDLKRGDATGGIGLWVGPGAIAHFRNLKVVHG
jgi:hypothetical protein